MILLPAIASSGKLATPVLSATVGSYLYTTDDEWNGSYPTATLSWTAVNGATSGYEVWVANAPPFMGEGAPYLLKTVSAGTTSTTVSTGEDGSYQRFFVKAKAGSVVSAASNSKYVYTGQPRKRQASVTEYNESAQEDYSGTTNGRWTTNFQGSVFNIYVKSVKWEITVPFGSAGNYVTSSSSNRNLVLIRPGTDFTVPDNQRETYTYTQSYAGTNTQNGTWGVNPNGTGWSTDSNGTMRTYRVDFTMTITGTVPYQNEVAPSVS